MENSIHKQKEDLYFTKEIKPEPKVVVLYETWNEDNRSYGIIKAKGYTALTAEVNKENAKHDVLNAKLINL